MSGDPGTTDLMVDALLAAHEVPALGADFASRVLAAAQSLPAGPGVNSPWPRRSLRPWRRSPLWFGFIALNIVAASAVAAMVSGIPVWHHLTEIVQNVKHSLHREPIHSARHRVAPPRRVASHAPASSPAAIASTVSEPHPTSAIPIEAREAIAPLRQPGARPLAIGGPSNHHARMAQARQREKLIRHRPNTPLEMLPHRARGNGFPITARRHAIEDISRAPVGVDLKPTRPKLNPARQALYVRTGLFEFNPNRHDFGDKQFLGHTIKGSGFGEVEQAPFRRLKGVPQMTSPSARSASSER